MTPVMRAISGWPYSMRSWSMRVRISISWSKSSGTIASWEYEAAFFHMPGGYTSAHWPGRPSR